MSELVVCVFRDRFRAPEVLNELRRRDWCWVRDLDDAVVVSLDEAGKARIQISVDLSGCRASAWARLWGSLLTPMLFLPVTNILVEAADGFTPLDERSNGRRSQDAIEKSPEEKWWSESLQSSNYFKRDVGALMGPNRSALFMLLRNARAPVALEQLRNYGDTIVHTSLTSELDEKMHAMCGI